MTKYIALLSTPTGVITYPFAEDKDNIYLLGNTKKFAIPKDKINEQDIPNELVNLIERNMLEIKDNNMNDVSQDRNVANLLVIANNLMLDPNQPYSAYHALTDRNSKLVTVMNDLDMVQQFGITVQESSPMGYIMNVYMPISSIMKKIFGCLKVLQAIHKRGIIIGHNDLYNDRINILTARYYGLTDSYEHLLHLMDDQQLQDKYKEDTLRLFKLTTLIDIWNFTSLDSDFFKKVKLVTDKYIESDLNTWIIDEILDEFVKHYSTQKYK